LRPNQNVRHLEQRLPKIESAIADLSRALDEALAEPPEGDTAA
jgi:hypothetical protein